MSDASTDISQNPDSKWEICYTELCRRIDHQIDENERLEEQSFFILRTIIATIGVILTALSIIVSTNPNIIQDVALSEDSIRNISKRLTELLPILGEGQTELISLIFLIVFAFFISSSISKIFILVPFHAYNVIDPSILEPSSSATKMEVYFKEKINKENVRQSLISDYSEIAEQNRELLEETREEWEKCYTTLRKGTVHFGISLLFILTTMILQNPLLTAVILCGLILWLIMKQDLQKIYNMTYQYLILEPLTDLPISIISVSFFATTTRIDLWFITDSPFLGLLSLAALVGMISLIVIPASLDLERQRNLAIRSAGIGAITFVIWVMIELGTEDVLYFAYPEIENLLLSAFMGMSIGSILIFVSFMLQKLTNYIRNIDILSKY